MKLLIIGGSGLLGSKVMKAVSKRFHTIGTYSSHPFEMENCEIVQLDITNKDRTLKLIKEHNPDCVILTSALTNVDRCETHPKEAWRINVEGPKNVSEACKENDVKLIYVSTDYVFDGEKRFYTEEDEPNPISVYGETKLAGEKAVQNTCDDYAIARVSVLYGWNTVTSKPNFVTWIIDKLKKGEEVKLFTDQYTSPTLADNAAQALLAIFKKDKKGLYHTSGKGCISRFKIGKKIAKIFELDENFIKPITSDKINLPAKRPPQSCLDVSKAEKELGIKLMTVDGGLSEMRRQSQRIKC